MTLTAPLQGVARSLRKPSLSAPSSFSRSVRGNPAANFCPLASGYVSSSMFDYRVGELLQTHSSVVGGKDEARAGNPPA